MLQITCQLAIQSCLTNNAKENIYVYTYVSTNLIYLRHIRSRTEMTNKLFLNKKKLFPGKLNLELKKIITKCWVWSVCSRILASDTSEQMKNRYRVWDMMAYNTISVTEEWRLSQQDEGEDYRCDMVWQTVIAMAHWSGQLKIGRDGYNGMMSETCCTAED